MSSETMINKKGGKKTLTNRMDDLEKALRQLSSVIEEKQNFMKESRTYCKQMTYQNNTLSFILDAYNNSYMRIIDDKIQQMQHLAKLQGYLDKMITDGNYNIDDMRRAKKKQNEILHTINETRSNLENIETILSLNVSNMN
jgi:septal ring factor EnvC (AmiA/AmiB activator)